MTTVAIVPEPSESMPPQYRALSGKRQAVGKTAGQALDAIMSQIGEGVGGTLIVVQSTGADRFFTEQQQQRLEVLMARWRASRDAGTSLAVEEQAELDTLVEDEIRATAERTHALLKGLSQ